MDKIGNRNIKENRIGFYRKVEIKSYRRDDFMKNEKAIVKGFEIFKEVYKPKKDEVVVEERAYEVVKEWYTSQKRHFVTDGKVQEDELKVEIYGRTMENGFVAIIPGAMKKVLEDNGYDKNEVLNAWKRKGYIRIWY